MKNILYLSAFCLMLVACAPRIDPTLTSGVRGQVLIGPTCPVVRIDDPCLDEPYQAKLTVLSLDGREVTQALSDAEGKFEIKLPPGEYILHSENLKGERFPYADDAEFIVNPDEFTEIEIHFDSGIR